MLQDLEEELLEFCKAKEILIIYGAGHFGELVEQFLKEYGIKIFCFCVTQIDEKERFKGYPIKEIAEVHKNYRNAGIIIAVSERFSGEVLKKANGLHCFYDEYLLREIEQRHTMNRLERCANRVIVKERMLCSVGEISF